jgi:hypothetical protein
MDDAQAKKMFVRSLNNSSAKIIMAFLFAGSAMDVGQLREWTGLKRETIYDGLDDLQALGKLEKQVLAHGRHVWLPAGDLLPGFQMSENRTPELPDVQIPDTTTLIGGGESINLIDSQLINSTHIQMSVFRTSELPDAIQILQHTDLLFDGALVVSRGLEDRDPLSVLAWCAYAYSRKSRLNGAGGLVRNRLVDNQVPPEWAKQRWRETLPCDFLEALGLIEYTCEDCQATFKTMGELSAHEATHPRAHACSRCDRAFGSEEELDVHYEQEHVPASLEPDESVNVPIHGSMSAAHAWQSVLDQLETEMPRASFDSWVRDSKAVRYGGNVLSVGVRTAYARDWLESRLASTVERLLVGILNASVSVVFVVSEIEA